jgi:2-amino-4-hydroxy-6-hydroxymethyldihydropteridine diphosphokinase
MPLAAIGLGSNFGDRAAHLHAALDALRADPTILDLRASAAIETAPVGPIPQGPYLNAAAAFTTDCSPRSLLDLLHAIEQSRGRNRKAEPRWGPRTLDLDLLLYDDLVIDEPGLRVPHPSLHERRFVLEPLAAILPDSLVPGLGLRVRELLVRLPS